MKPFNELATCPKCGYQKVAVHYCDGHGCLYGHYDRAVLHRRCERCGATWDESPLDAGGGMLPGQRWRCAGCGSMAERTPEGRCSECRREPQPDDEDRISISPDSMLPGDDRDGK